MRILTLVLAVLALSAFIGCQSKPMVVSDSESSQDGIKVHGHWVIEVMDLDGTLVNRREFDNNLMKTGQTNLARFLTRERTVGLWEVMLKGLGENGHPCENDEVYTVPMVCWLIEPDAESLVASPGGWNKPSELPERISNNLTVTTIEGSGNENVRLNGTAIAMRETTITQVMTRLGICDAGISPPVNESCFPDSFSMTPVGFPAVPVLPGQQILVTIVYEFSTGY
jgi:hypothetical protein